MLYFGAGWGHQVLGPGYNAVVFDMWNRKVGRSVPARMKDEVVRDCQEVRHVALLSGLWRSRGRVHLISDGADLRADVKEAFPGVRRLNLVAEQEVVGNSTPGFIEFAKAVGGHEALLANEFATRGLSEEEKSGGVSPPFQLQDLDVRNEMY